MQPSIGRAAANVIALGRAWRDGDLAATSRGVTAQVVAMADAVRFALTETPAQAALGPALPLPASDDGSVVTVEFASGRASFLEPLPRDRILGRRYTHYQRFLALVALLSPGLSGRARVHLRDEHPQAPAGEAPELVFNRRFGAHDAFVLVPDVHFVHHRGYTRLRRRITRRGPPWHERRPRAYWRGSSTGGSLDAGDDPGGNRRVALCRSSLAHPRLLDARLGRIVNCHESHRRRLEADGLVDSFVPPEQQTGWRYLVSVDGWAAEWEGLVWKLASGSTLLMVESAWEQWLAAGLEPFRHFVPVRADLGDLVERIEWCRANDDACRDIAREAAAYAERAVTFPAAVRFCQRQLGVG
jgi:hypothetical protein